MVISRGRTLWLLLNIAALMKQTIGQPLTDYDHEVNIIPTESGTNYKLI